MAEHTCPYKQCPVLEDKVSMKSDCMTNHVANAAEHVALWKGVADVDRKYDKKYDTMTKMWLTTMAGIVLTLLTVLLK